MGISNSTHDPHHSNNYSNNQNLHITPNNHTTPNTPNNKKRKAIPKNVRHEVWKTYAGTSIYGLCYCCRNQIEINNWHAGHVQPATFGGPDTIRNLRPLCAACNLSMGTTPMAQYIRNCGYQVPVDLL